MVLPEIVPPGVLQPHHEMPYWPNAFAPLKSTPIRLLTMEIEPSKSTPA
jgi:hypothetical protein